MKHLKFHLERTIQSLRVVILSLQVVKQSLQIIHDFVWNILGEPQRKYIEKQYCWGCNMDCCELLLFSKVRLPHFLWLISSAQSMVGLVICLSFQVTIFALVLKPCKIYNGRIQIFHVSNALTIFTFCFLPISLLSGCKMVRAVYECATLRAELNLFLHMRFMLGPLPIEQALVVTTHKPDLVDKSFTGRRKPFRQWLDYRRIKADPEQP